MRDLSCFSFRIQASVLAIVAFSFSSPATTSAVELHNREQGHATFVPAREEAKIAARFQMQQHRFSYEIDWLPPISRRIDVGDVTFPSAMTTESEANNTVHCEYYRPRGAGPFPAVVVLHILGGDFPLSRAFANSLAQHGVASLFLKMPYYGPRRDPKDPTRMISHEPKQTVAGMTQAVLDIRRGAAWLASQEEIDKDQLGIFGISLGGITGALAITAEPRLKNVCLLLAGGNVGEVTWQARETRRLRDRFLAAGGTKEQLLAELNKVDPIAYTQGVRDRRILMFNATHDEVVPKQCTLSLWESLGRPPIQWFVGGHYTVAVHMPTMLVRVPRFFVSAAQGPPKFPGKKSKWHGFDRFDYEVDGKPVVVVAPKEPAVGHPWVWHGEFFGHKPAPDIEVLKQGRHVVYMRVPNLLGSPKAVKHWDAFYADLTKRGLAKKAALVGLSRGGLYCYNWAAANPDKVACIYGDAPVCDFKSWPGGKPQGLGAGKGSASEWGRVLTTYGFASREEAIAYKKNPVDNLQSLAKARIPLLHVYGDADEVVPWKENTGRLADRYRELGGSIQLIGKPGVGHHPHGLENPQPIVDFILKNTQWE